MTLRETRSCSTEIGLIGTDWELGLFMCAFALSRPGHLNRATCRMLPIERDTWFIPNLPALRGSQGEKTKITTRLPVDQVGGWLGIEEGREVFFSMTTSNRPGGVHVGT